MNRSQLKRKISGAITKYGKEKRDERIYLVNVIMGYVDFYYDKFYIKYNEKKLIKEIKVDGK